MDYNKEERLKLKLEFFKMLLRLKLDPARMQLLTGFFDSYIQLSPEEDEKVKNDLLRELPNKEVSQVTEILTSWHRRGIEEGKIEGKIEALQSSIKD